MHSHLVYAPNKVFLASIITAAACFESTVPPHTVPPPPPPCPPAPLVEPACLTQGIQQPQITDHRPSLNWLSRGPQTIAGTKFNLSIAIYQTGLEGVDCAPEGIVGI